MANALDEAKNMFSQLTQGVGNAISGIPQGVGQLAGNIGQGVQGYFNNVGQQLAKGPPSYPQQLQQNFGSAIRSAFPITQVPQRNFTFANNIKNPIVSFAAGIPQQLLNTPNEAYQGISNTVGNIGKAIQGQNVTPQQFIGGAAPLGQAALNVFGLGKLGGAIEGLGSEGIGSSILKGALSGGAFGGTSGYLSGLEGYQNEPTLGGQLWKSVNPAVQGAKAGALAGGIMGGVGGVSAKVSKSLAQQMEEAKMQDYANRIDHNMISDDPVFEAHKAALNLNSKNENIIQNAVADWQSGKTDDPKVNQTLDMATRMFLPQYQGLPVPREAMIWDNMLAIQNGEMPKFIPQELYPLHQAINDTSGRAVWQGGFAKIPGKEPQQGAQGSLGSKLSKLTSDQPSIDELNHKYTGKALGLGTRDQALQRGVLRDVANGSLYDVSKTAPPKKLTYEQAIKAPEGIANTTGDSYQAIVAEDLGQKTATRPKSVYEWAKKTNTDLQVVWKDLANGNIKDTDIVKAVLNDQPINTSSIAGLPTVDEMVQKIQAKQKESLLAKGFKQVEPNVAPSQKAVGSLYDVGAKDEYSASIRKMKAEGRPLMADEQKWLSGDYSSIESQAKKLYGTTTDPSQSLYMTKDGELIGNQGAGSEHKNYSMDLTGQMQDTSLLPKRSGMIETVYSPKREYNVRIFTDPTPEQIAKIKEVSSTVPITFIDDLRNNNIGKVTGFEGSGSKLNKYLFSDVKSPVQDTFTDAKSALALPDEYNKALENKPILDGIVSNAAQDVNGRVITNLKSPETAIKKVGQKLSEGRDYTAQSVNDYTRGRIIVNTEKQVYKAVDSLHNSLDKAGLKITKEEDFFKKPEEGYKGYHIDVQFPNGQTGEIQIHSEKSVASSEATHMYHSMFDDKTMPKQMEENKSAVQNMVENMSTPKAEKLAKNIEFYNEQKQGAMPSTKADFGLNVSTTNDLNTQLPVSQQQLEGRLPPSLPKKKNPNFANFPSQTEKASTGQLDQQAMQENQLNPSYKNIISPEVKQTLENAPVVRGGGRPGGENPLNNIRPNYESNVKTIQNDLRAARGKFDLDRDLAIQNSDKNIKMWNGQSKGSQLGFMQTIQEGKQQGTPQLQNLASDYRQRFDADYQLAQSINPKLGYKENYFTKSGIWADPGAASQFYNDWQRKARLANTPGSFKQAVFPTIYDGLQAGLQLRETNPETLYLNNHLQVLKAKMAGDFLTEQEAKGSDMLQVQKTIDKYMDPGIGGNQLYRGFRQATNSLNAMQLGFSGFHALGTTINASISKSALGLNQLLTGHPVQALGSFVRAPTAALEYVMRGNEMLKSARAGELTPDIKNVIEGGGRLQPQEQYKIGGLQSAIQDVQANGIGAIPKALVQVPLGVLSNIQKPLMEWWVPRLKNGAAADLIENNVKNIGKDATPDQLRSIKANAIDSIDNRFGQLVQDNLFWNKSVKNMLQIFMRSPGWNIGTVRELGLGARDLFDVKRLFTGGGVSDRAAYTVALPITVGLMGAAYQYLKTGYGPQNLVDYFYPRTGQVDKNTGKEERVSFPTYMKDVYAFSKNPLQTIANKQSPLISAGLQEFQNKDYYGNPIRDVNAPALTQARQSAAHEVMNMLPFSVSTAGKRLNPSAETGAESFMGVTKAPASVTGGYYDAKSEVSSKLSPQQQKVLDYLTTSSQYGGPTSAEKAPIYLKNPWAIDATKQMALAANPKDPLWSRPTSDIKAYMAYQAETQAQVKAQIRLKFPWITDLQSQINQSTQAGVQAAQQQKQQQANSFQGKLGNALGVYQPQPTTPYTGGTYQPSLYSQLPPQARQVVDAYTASPTGSAARKQILAQNPWLPQYWNANSANIQANPIQNTSPLAQFLQSQGINPQTQYTNYSSSGGGGVGAALSSRIMSKMSSKARRPKRAPKVKALSASRLKLGKLKKFKLPKITRTTFGSKSPSFKNLKFA